MLRVSFEAEQYVRGDDGRVGWWPWETISAMTRSTSLIARPLAVAALLFSCGGRTGLNGYVEASNPSQTGDGGATDGTASVAGGPPVYLVDDTGTLLRFSPSSATFDVIGPISCDPLDGGTVAEAMAIDRAGTVYLGLGDSRDQRLVRVSGETGECESSAVSTGALKLVANGLAFSADPGGQSETLYGLVFDALDRVALALVDAQTLAVRQIGEIVNADLGGGYLYSGADGVLQLTATRDGALFFLMWLYDPDIPPDGARVYQLLEVDKASGGVDPTGPSRWVIPSAGSPLTQFPAVAAAFSGSELYLFGVDPAAGATAALRIDEHGAVVTEVAQHASRVVLAGAQTAGPTR